MSTKRRRLKPARGLIYVVAIAALVLMAGPLLVMVATSLVTAGQALANPPQLLPTDPQFQNYPNVFSQVPFLRYILNSLIVASTVTVVSLVLHSMAGYSLARIRYPGRDTIFIGILSTMMVPFAIIMVPLFIIVRELGWVNSYLGLIVPLIPNAYGIFLFRQFYSSLPLELEQAAIVDGASRLQVYRLIALPLSLPIFAALGALYFLANWNNFLWPLIVAQTQDLWLVQIGIQDFAGQHQTQWNLVMAASGLALIPTLVLFSFLQRRLVEGVKLSGLRG
jgi:multiple sugar transport system permease protein